MHRFPFFFLLLSSLLLSACGGGGDGPSAAQTEPLIPAAALAAGLERVEVQDGNGLTIMQHRFSEGADAHEEIVTTTQGAGHDGIWGTADDWRSAEAHCRYQPGEALDARLLFSATFQPESFLSVGGAACLWRRPMAGDIQVSGTGGYVDTGVFELFNAVRGSDSGQILFDVLGWGQLLEEGDLMQLLAALSNTTVSNWGFSLSSSPAGLRNCPALCEEIQAVTIPADTACNVNCTGLDNIVYNPYAGLDASGNPPPAGVRIFNGTRQYPVYAQGRLVQVVKSIALENPLAFPMSYEAYAYDAGGALQEIGDYDHPGADGKWFTADDRLTGYMQQQALSGGWQRIYYSAAGEDGIWKTADDIVARGVALERDTAGRIGTVRVCRPVNANPFPADNFWQAGTEACNIMIFHYATPAS